MQHAPEKDLMSFQDISYQKKKQISEIRKCWFLGENINEFFSNTENQMQYNWRNTKKSNIDTVTVQKHLTRKSMKGLSFSTRCQWLGCL